MLEKFGINYPVIQAPMAGITTPEFVAACANAGILGAIGAGYLNGEETRALIRDVKTLTRLPFMVNVFVPEDNERDEEMIKKAVADLAPVRKVLGVPKEEYQLQPSPFNEQINVIIEEGVKICSFTFGLPNDEVIRRLKAENVFLIGTATTKREAVLAEEAGMDAVVVQGAEAGGHRGSFDGPLTLIPLRELLADVVQFVRIPVIAAGGIVSKELAEQAFTLGAKAVQIGTALLATEESGAHFLHKEAVLQAVEGSTGMTDAFSGKAARGIRNLFMEVMTEATIAPYPIQNNLTKAIRKEAARQGNANYMSLWAGEHVHLCGGGTVRDVISKLI